MIDFFSKHYNHQTLDKMLRIVAANHYHYNSDDWNRVMRILGRAVCEEIGDDVLHKDKVAVFVDLLLEKHKLYGATPLTKWGPLGVIIRIDSKYARVLNLRKLDYTPITDESIHDTLWDILGYCVLGYMLTKESGK